MNGFVLIVVITFLQNTIVQVRSYYVIQVSYSLLDSISQAMGHGIVICSLELIDNGYKRSGLWSLTWVGRWGGHWM